MSAEPEAIVALDIGGSRIKATLIKAGQPVTLVDERKTPLDSLEEFKNQIRDLVVQLTDNPKAVSISITGVIDPETGLIKCANIPCIDGCAIQVELEQLFRVPVLMANDADCFALAEASCGAGEGHGNVFGIILGSGVGGGWAVDGKLVSGGGGFTGEWGHGSKYSNYSEYWSHPIPHFACNCGNYGCLNTIGGARGIEHLHQFLSKQQLNSKQILKNWLSGDEIAVTTILVMSDLVSNQLALVLNVTGATSVPVGGGLANVTELIELLDQQVRRKMLHYHDQPLLVQGQCGDEAGLTGAAIVGIQHLEQ